MSFTPFRFAVRWLGVILLAIGCIGSAFRIIRSFQTTSSPMRSQVIMVVPVGWLATALVGIVLIIVSLWFFRSSEART